MFFISIIAIFICAFGVTTQATMYEGNEMSLGLIKKLLNNAYWPIYGDMKILDKLEEPCEADDPTCPLRSGVAFSYVLLMVYMVVANILLINLLIAMFRYQLGASQKYHSLMKGDESLSFLFTKLHFPRRPGEHGSNMEVPTLPARLRVLRLSDPATSAQLHRLRGLVHQLFQAEEEPSTKVNRQNQ